MPRTARKKPASPYSTHPSFSAMEEAFLVNLPKKTGKTLEEWIAIVKASGSPTEKERRAWLMTEHGLTTNYAWWVAERAAGRGALRRARDHQSCERGYEQPSDLSFPARTSRWSRHAFSFSRSLATTSFGARATKLSFVRRAARLVSCLSRR